MISKIITFAFLLLFKTWKQNEVNKCAKQCCLIKNIFSVQMVPRQQAMVNIYILYIYIYIYIYICINNNAVLL